VRNNAIAIAQAAKRLNDLREDWLNPDEWTHAVPEVTPLGMDQSPYPDRILPKPGISEEDLKALAKTHAHQPLQPTAPLMARHGAPPARPGRGPAYGWTDYTADMPDEEILKRLLALNLQRSASNCYHINSWLRTFYLRYRPKTP
jgi:hypothetical protein